MFRLISMTSDDLLKAVDHDSDYRSGNCSPNIYRFDPKTGVIDFVTRCSGSKNSWYQRVRFDDWQVLLPQEAFEKAFSNNASGWQQMLQEFPEINELDVKVGCGCPYYLYYGSGYILDQLGAGEPSLPRYKNQPHPENRFPAIRDPGLEHTLCKHLIAVLRRYF